MQNWIAGAILLLIATFSACEIADITPEWTPDYLGPLVYTSLSVEDVSELRDLDFDQEVKANEIVSNWDGTFDSIPPIDSSQGFGAGPYPFRITEHFEEIDADTLIFKISFTNTLPIPISPGTILAFYNSDDNSLLFRETLTQETYPGEDVVIERELYDKRVNADINFYVENFSTSGSRDPVTFEAGTQTVFTFSLLFLKLNELIIAAPKGYSVEDTAHFNYEQRDPTNTVEGNLILSFNNRFPMSFDMQIYFMRDDGGTWVTIDSLFNSRVKLPSPDVSSQGEVISDITVRDTIPLNENLIQVMNQTDFIKGYFAVRTAREDVNGAPIQQVEISIREQNYMRWRMIGDLTFKVD